VVYARTLGRRTYTFQVSGRLWRNSLIMMDRETGTSWSQVTGRAIDGAHRGAQLQKLEAVQTTWERWRSVHPDTLVLKKSDEVLGSPYQKYFDDPDRMGLFRAQWLADRMPGKTLVFGAMLGSHALAVTEGALDGEGMIKADVGGVPVVLARGPEGGVRAFAARIDDEELELSRDPATGKVMDAGGSTWDLATGRSIAGPRLGARLETVAVTPVFWFAWSSFFPNTQVIDRAPRRAGDTESVPVRDVGY
jgi:hypothetical protein